jgi:hypothetical protein
MVQGRSGGLASYRPPSRGDVRYIATEPCGLPLRSTVESAGPLNNRNAGWYPEQALNRKMAGLMTRYTVSWFRWAAGVDRSDLSLGFGGSLIRVLGATK